MVIIVYIVMKFTMSFVGAEGPGTTTALDIVLHSQTQSALCAIVFSAVVESLFEKCR